MELDLIQSLIEKAIPGSEVDAQGDGYHYEVTVISSAFENKSQVQRQQMVYQAVMDHIQSGELHALTIKAKTPESSQGA